MIEDALKGLAVVMEREFTKMTGFAHTFKVIHADMEDSSRGNKHNPKDAITGYIRPASFQTDNEGRKVRNNTITVQSEGATHTLHLHPIKVEVECKISLYRGHPQLYKTLPCIIMAQSHGLLNYSLNVQVGDTKIPTSVSVKQDVSIDMPVIETDADAGESALVFSLTIHNIFSLLGNIDTPKISMIDGQTKVHYT